MADITPENNLAAFIPEIYSKKLARVAKQFTKFIERNCNKEWEGEIRNFGDTVRIALPDPNNVNVAIAKENTDVCPVAGAVTPTEKQLQINNVASFALKFSDVETKQSQFDILNGYGAIAMQKIGDKKDKQVMAALINNTDANRIGTPAAPVAVTKDDIYDKVVDMGTALMTAGYLNADGFYSFKGNQEEAEHLQGVLTVDPTIYGLMLKSTQLTHPTAAGDQVIERGRKGMMGGFEIDVNTVLTTFTAEADEDGLKVDGLVAGTHIAIAATKMAVTYANQITKVEKLRDPDCFADIVRGLELYGYTVVHPKAACVAFLTA